MDSKICDCRKPSVFSTPSQQPPVKRVSVTSRKIDVTTDCGRYRVQYIVNIIQHDSIENCSYKPTNVKTMKLVFVDSFIC